MKIQELIDYYHATAELLPIGFGLRTIHEAVVVKLQKGEELYQAAKLSLGSAGLADAIEAYEPEPASKDARIKELIAERDTLNKRAEEMSLKNGMYVFEIEEYASGILDLREQLADAKIQEKEHHLMLHEMRIDEDRLREKLTEQEQQLQVYETQLTLQEEGPAQLLERCERQQRNLDYYAERLAETNEYIPGLKHNLVRVIAQNTDLHRQLAECRAQLKQSLFDNMKLQDRLDEGTAQLLEHRQNLDHYAKRLAEANDELHEWQRNGGPSAPTIVRRTWQAVYTKPQKNGGLTSLEWSSSTERKGRRDTAGYIHRDYYSDGTVTVALEPITGE